MLSRQDTTRDLLSIFGGYLMMQRTQARGVVRSFPLKPESENTPTCEKFQKNLQELPNKAGQAGATRRSQRTRISRKDTI